SAFRFLLSGADIKGAAAGPRTAVPECALLEEQRSSKIPRTSSDSKLQPVQQPAERWPRNSNGCANFEKCCNVLWMQRLLGPPACRLPSSSTAYPRTFRSSTAKRFNE